MAKPVRWSAGSTGPGVFSGCSVCGLLIWESWDVVLGLREAGGGERGGGLEEEAAAGLGEAHARFGCGLGGEGRMAVDPTHRRRRDEWGTRVLCGDEGG